MVTLTWQIEFCLFLGQDHNPSPMQHKTIMAPGAEPLRNLEPLTTFKPRSRAFSPTIDHANTSRYIRYPQFIFDVRRNGLEWKYICTYLKLLAPDSAGWIWRACSITKLCKIGPKTKVRHMEALSQAGLVHRVRCPHGDPYWLVTRDPRRMVERMRNRQQVGQPINDEFLRHILEWLSITPPLVVEHMQSPDHLPDSPDQPTPVRGGKGAFGWSEHFVQQEWLTKDLPKDLPKDVLKRIRYEMAGIPTGLIRSFEIGDPARWLACCAIATGRTRFRSQSDILPFTNLSQDGFNTAVENLRMVGLMTGWTGQTREALRKNFDRPRQSCFRKGHYTLSVSEKGCRSNWKCRKAAGLPVSERVDDLKWLWGKMLKREAGEKMRAFMKSEFHGREAKEILTEYLEVVKLNQNISAAAEGQVKRLETTLWEVEQITLESALPESDQKLAETPLEGQKAVLRSLVLADKFVLADLVKVALAVNSLRSYRVEESNSLPGGQTLSIQEPVGVAQPSAPVEHSVTPATPPAKLEPKPRYRLNPNRPYERIDTSLVQVVFSTPPQHPAGQAQHVDPVVVQTVLEALPPTPQHPIQDSPAVRNLLSLMRYSYDHMAQFRRPERTPYGRIIRPKRTEPPALEDLLASPYRFQHVCDMIMELGDAGYLPDAHQIDQSAREYWRASAAQAGRYPGPDGVGGLPWGMVDHHTLDTLGHAGLQRINLTPKLYRVCRAAHAAGVRALGGVVVMPEGATKKKIKTIKKQEWYGTFCEMVKTITDRYRLGHVQGGMKFLRNFMSKSWRAPDRWRRYDHLDVGIVRRWFTQSPAGQALLQSVCHILPDPDDQTLVSLYERIRKGTLPLLTISFLKMMGPAFCAEHVSVDWLLTSTRREQWLMYDQMKDRGELQEPLRLLFSDWFGHDFEAPGYGSLRPAFPFLDMFHPAVDHVSQHLVRMDHDLATLSFDMDWSDVLESQGEARRRMSEKIMKLTKEMVTKREVAKNK